MADRQPAVITVQPGVGVMEYANQLPDDESDWQTELTDCCKNLKWGCMGFWCPCCTLCVASQRLGEHDCYPCCFGPIGLSVRFRTLYRVRMTLCREGCCWLWCGWCMTCRLMNEMDARGCDRRPLAS